VGAQDTILQPWEFSKEKREHRNAVLHNTQLESSRMIQAAEINDAIMKLYEKVNTYSAKDHWCFNLPLAL
jgi:hypothetical protein